MQELSFNKTKPSLSPSGDGSSSPVKILLATREKLLLQVVKHYFGERGLEVVGASDGLAAWRAAKDQPFQMAMIAESLTFLSGLELIERLQQEEETNFPILFLNNYENAQLEKTALSLGAVEVMKLPVEIPDLYAACRRILGGRKEAI